MLHAGSNLSRRRLDYPPARSAGRSRRGRRGATGWRWVARVRAPRRATSRACVTVQAAIESMNGARFVHDTPERCGWEVEVADAQKVKGLAPLACKIDRIDAWVLAALSRRHLVPAIWLPDFEQRQERERARRRLFLVRKRSSLRHRVHARLLAFGRTWRWAPITATSRCADRARDRVGARLHNRRRDRRHPPLRVTEEADRLHRAVPTHLPIRWHRPPPSPRRGDLARAHPQTSRPLRQGPRWLWPHRRPWLRCATGARDTPIEPGPPPRRR